LASQRIINQFIPHDKQMQIYLKSQLSTDLKLENSGITGKFILIKLKQKNIYAGCKRFLNIKSFPARSD
jgi:hypothetical protein